MNVTLIVVLSVFFFVLILVVAIVALVSASNRNPGLPGLGQACTSSCAGDLVCSSGFCLLPVPGSCAVSSQCVDGAYCVAGECKYSTGHSCSTDSECATGHCVSGVCSTLTTSAASSFSTASGASTCDSESGASTLVEDSEVRPSEVAVIDAAQLQGHTLMLFGSGDIIVQHGTETWTVSNPGFRPRRIFVFQGRLYALWNRQIYRLQSALSSPSWGWSLILTQDPVTHVSCTLDGSHCWIQNETTGLLVSSHQEFGRTLVQLPEPGLRVLGRTPQKFLVIRPDRTVSYSGQVWTDVVAAVLTGDDTPVIEQRAGLHLALIDGEAVVLE